MFLLRRFLLSFVYNPNCKLRAKRRRNRGEEEKECVWGYGMGVAIAKVEKEIDCVLAEHTQTFNENDITYFQPLQFRHVLVGYQQSDRLIGEYIQSRCP